MTAFAQCRRRSEAAQQLEAAGITGHAAAALLDETATSRHQWRVEAAAVAARTWAGGDGMPAAAVLLLDMFGVGGHGGVSGDATLRHPAFRDCGKGRKHAGDGAAWTAAICAAYAEMTAHRRARIIATEDGCGMALAVDGAQAAPLPFNLEDIPWLLTVAREGLRRSVGLPGWFHLPVDWEGGIDHWAGVVNFLGGMTT